MDSWPQGLPIAASSEEDSLSTRELAPVSRAQAVLKTSQNQLTWTNMINSPSGTPQAGIKTAASGKMRDGERQEPRADGRGADGGRCRSGNGRWGVRGRHSPLFSLDPGLGSGRGLIVHRTPCPCSHSSFPYPHLCPSVPFEHLPFPSLTCSSLSLFKLHIFSEALPDNFSLYLVNHSFYKVFFFFPKPARGQNIEMKGYRSLLQGTLLD